MGKKRGGGRAGTRSVWESGQSGKVKNGYWERWEDEDWEAYETAYGQDLLRETSVEETSVGETFFEFEGKNYSNKIWELFTSPTTKKQYIFKRGTTTTKKKRCSHWETKVPLLDGLEVLASGWFSRPGWEDGRFVRINPPDLGFYLDSSWTESSEVVASPGLHVPVFGKSNGYPMVHFTWGDFGVPEVRGPRLIQLARWVLKEIASGKRVEVGCLGAHGRTGTFIAIMLMVQGLTARQAKSHLWTNYCFNAVETQEQEALLNKLQPLLKGE